MRSLEWPRPRDKEFMASCLLALVRLFVKKNKKDLEQLHLRKRRVYTYDKYGDRRKTALSYEDENIALEDDTEEAEDEKRWKMLENEKNEACKKLDAVLNATYHMRDSFYAAEANLLFGIIVQDPQKVITGLYMYKRIRRNIGFIEGIHILMSWRPRPYLNRLDVCRKVAETFGLLLDIVYALILPNKTNSEGQAEMCRNFYIVKREHSDKIIKYRPLVKEGTRIEINLKDKEEAWSDVALHEYIAHDLLKKAAPWPAGVENLVRRELKKLSRCPYVAVGVECPNYSSGNRCDYNHMPYNNFRCLEIIKSIITMLLMGGSATNIIHILNGLKSNKDAVGFLPPVIKLLDERLKTCNITEWAERLHEVLFPTHCFTRIMTQTKPQCTQLLQEIRLELVSPAIYHASSEMFNDEIHNFREANTNLLLKICLLNVLIDPQLKRFWQMLQAEERSFNAKMTDYRAKETCLNPSQDAYEERPRDLGFFYSVTKTTSGHKGHTTSIQKEHREYFSYFRIFVNAISMLHADPVETVNCLDRFICFIASRPKHPLKPSVANFAFISELHFTVICAILLRLFSTHRVNVLLPASYMALLNFWDVTMCTEKFSMMQSLQNLQPVQSIEKLVIDKANRCVDILIGLYVRSKFDMLADGMRVNESNIMHGEMERILVLALVFLVNSGSDGVLSEKCALKLYEALISRSAETLSSYAQGNKTWKIPRRVEDTLKSICNMKGRREAINVLKNLLNNRDGEYLYSCTWRADNFMTGVSYKSIDKMDYFGDVDYMKFSKFNVEKRVDKGPEKTSEILTAEDDEKFLTSLVTNQSELLQVVTERSEEMPQINSELKQSQLPTDQNMSTEAFVVPVLVCNEAECMICGVDYGQEDWDAETNEAWTTEDTSNVDETDQRKIAAENRRRIHENSPEHHSNIRNYYSFQNYCKAELPQLVSNAESAVNDLRSSSIAKYPLDESLKQTVEQFIANIERMIDDILDLVKSIVSTLEWFKLEELMTMGKQFPEMLSQSHEGVTEAVKTAEQVII